MRETSDFEIRSPSDSTTFDLARRDAGHVGLLDHGHERLLGPLARLEEAREVAALAQLRDRELELAGAGVPAAWSVAVAVGGAVFSSLLGADEV